MNEIKPIPLTILIIVIGLFGFHAPSLRAQETSANFGAGSVNVGFDSRNCDGSIAGALRYNSGSGCVQLCDGGSWNCTKPSSTCTNDTTSRCLLDVSRVTADPQFTSANIASGVNILGVTGTFTAPSTVPVISAGGAHTCGVRSPGAAWCWGEAASGKLGDGQSSTDRTRSEWVHTDTAAPGWSDWTSIDAGVLHTCGIRSDGTAWCWGESANGRLGDGQTTTDRPRPVQVHTDTASPGWSDWVSISTGVLHTCGIRGDGTAWCWGGALNGRLGDGQSATDRSRPVQVHTDTASPGWSDWVSISAGGGNTCGIRSDGKAWCWGWADSGRLGDGQSATDRTRPVQVHTDTGTPGWSDWVSIDAGGIHTCGIRGTGTAWCWGSAASGRLGDGQTTTNRPRPVQVHTDTASPGWSDWASIETGSDHVCGLRSGGSFWCWGESANGRLGDGQTATDRTRPWPVSAF